MNRALYYIAFVLCLVYVANSALGAIVYHYQKRPFFPLDLLVWFNPCVMAFAGTLFLKKHRNAVDSDSAFDKAPVVSVLGIICFVAGVVWLANNIRWVIDVSRMPQGIDLPIVEQVLAPIVLLVSGVFFGFFYSPNRVARR